MILYHINFRIVFEHLLFYCKLQKHGLFFIFSNKNDRYTHVMVIERGLLYRQDALQLVYVFDSQLECLDFAHPLAPVTPKKSSKHISHRRTLGGLFDTYYKHIHNNTYNYTICRADIESVVGRTKRRDLIMTRRVGYVAPRVVARTPFS